ncbi:hypothetical protein [Paraburkholderia sp. SIMBA_054]|uniref:hypothetical protein n=1 Tax=Paraburkholderia sp. SIMBA_054 TaxID=3085795 RepID=UPI00397C523D
MLDQTPDDLLPDFEAETENLGAPRRARGANRELEAPRIDDAEFVERAQASRWNRKAVEGTSVAMPLTRQVDGQLDGAVMNAHRDLAMIARRS